MPVALVVCDASSRPPVTRRRERRAPPLPRTMTEADPLFAGLCPAPQSPTQWRSGRLRPACLHAEFRGENGLGPARATKKPGGFLTR
eukprot:4724474-Pyramimonas_sp.AAC.1